ncbi:MAG: GPO family capsid scaffolding protein [Thiolinea sp.]
MAPLTTDWIRAAVEGSTIDGRTLSATQLQQMAQTYHQDTYNARIWKEHVRGITSDSPFKPLGDVVAVKAETLSTGPLAGKVALSVVLAPLPELITLVRGGEKIHLSIEMEPDFSGSGQAYLVGLGVTDSPASLGTEIMKFSQRGHRHGLYSAPLALSQDVPGAPRHTEARFF